jgi:hypothetical protein
VAVMEVMEEVITGEAITEVVITEAAAAVTMAIGEDTATSADAGISGTAIGTLTASGKPDRVRALIAIVTFGDGHRPSLSLWRSRTVRTRRISIPVSCLPRAKLFGLRTTSDRPRRGHHIWEGATALRRRRPENSALEDPIC